MIRVEFTKDEADFLIAVLERASITGSKTAQILTSVVKKIMEGEQIFPINNPEFDRIAEAMKKDKK